MISTAVRRTHGVQAARREGCVPIDISPLRTSWILRGSFAVPVRAIPHIGQERALVSVAFRCVLEIVRRSQSAKWSDVYVELSDPILKGGPLHAEELSRTAGSANDTTALPERVFDKGPFHMV